MSADLAKYASDHSIKFFLFNFTDLFGTQRAKLVPAEVGGKPCRRRVRALPVLPPGSTRRRRIPTFSSCLIRNAIIPLPWRPDVAWVAGDPWMNGKPLAQAPRLVLKEPDGQGGEEQPETDGRRRARIPSHQCRWHGDFRSARYPGKALLRPGGDHAPPRRDRRDLLDHDRTGLGRPIRTTTRTPTASSRSTGTSTTR